MTVENCNNIFEKCNFPLEDYNGLTRKIKDLKKYHPDSLPQLCKPSICGDHGIDCGGASMCYFFNIRGIFITHANPGKVESEC